MHKAIIVGCGLTGSIIARRLAEEKHYDVTILERSSHIAGNLYDYTDENGILVQKYGPHIFHTNSERVYEYINRFSNWNPFKLECMVYMNGRGKSRADQRASSRCISRPRSRHDCRNA